MFSSQHFHEYEILMSSSCFKYMSFDASTPLFCQFVDLHFVYACSSQYSMFCRQTTLYTRSHRLSHLIAQPYHIKSCLERATSNGINKIIFISSLLHSIYLLLSFFLFLFWLHAHANSAIHSANVQQASNVRDNIKVYVAPIK